MRLNRNPQRNGPTPDSTQPHHGPRRPLILFATTILFGFAAPASAQGGLGTGGVRTWLLDNIVPLGLMVVAVLLLWLGGGRGENSQVMRRVLGVIVALAVLGLSVTGAGKDIGTWLANLFRS